MLARAALPKATRPRLEEERAILPVLFGGVVPGRGVALGCGLVAFRSKGIAPGLKEKIISPLFLIYRLPLCQKREVYHRH